MLIEFQIFLVDKKLKTEIDENGKKEHIRFTISTKSNTIQYTEKLLARLIGDYRKFAISLILALQTYNIYLAQGPLIELKSARRSAMKLGGWNSR